MPITLTKIADGKAAHLKVQGRLTAEDYDKFVPELERLISDYGKIRLLVEMQDFHGWSAGAIWEDLKFDLKHFSHIERLALVGEKQWQKGMAVFTRPFTAAEVRYYDLEDLEEALGWIEAGLHSTATSEAPAR